MLNHIINDYTQRMHHRFDDTTEWTKSFLRWSLSDTRQKKIARYETKRLSCNAHWDRRITWHLTHFEWKKMIIHFFIRVESFFFSFKTFFFVLVWPQRVHSFSSNWRFSQFHDEGDWFYFFIIKMSRRMRRKRKN